MIYSISEAFSNNFLQQKNFLRKT